MKNKALKYSQTKISSKDLEIRPYHHSDFLALREAHLGRLPNQNRFDHAHQLGDLDTRALYGKFIARGRKLGQMRVHFIYGVFSRKSQELIGQADLLTINAQLNWANLGYYIYNQYTGFGFATEASQMMLSLAFNQLGFHRVEAAMELSHRASQKVALKCGMNFEGIRRKFFAHNGGVDFRVYGANAINFKSQYNTKRSSQ